MLKRNLFTKVVPLLAVVLVLAAMWAPVTYADAPEDTVARPVGTGNTGAPTMPEPGWASVVWVNHNGGSDELTVDFLGVYYTVAAKSGDEPGRMQLFVQPGTYPYSASVAGVGAVTRDIHLAAGQVIGLSFIASDPEQVNNNSSTLIDDNTFVTIGFEGLSVFEEDLTGQLAMLIEAVG